MVRCASSAFVLVRWGDPIRRQCTSSVRVHRHVTGAAPLIGCSATYQVQRPRACGGCGGCRAWVVFWAWAVFRLGHFVAPLWRLMLWFLKNVARNSPTCISNIEIASLKFCGFLDTYEKLGYPNYVRVLVDEAPKANSCVRSSSHDTVHDPRESSPLGSARDHIQETGGTAAIVDWRHVQDDGDVPVAVGAWRHTCSSTPMTRTPSKRAGSLITRRAPSARTAVLAALPGHAQGLGMRATVT